MEWDNDSNIRLTALFLKCAKICPHYEKCCIKQMVKLLSGDLPNLDDLVFCNLEVEHDISLYGGSGTDPDSMMNVT